MCVNIYNSVQDKFSTDYAISKCEKIRVSHKKKNFFTHKIQLSKKNFCILKTQADVNIAMDNQHVDDVERERMKERKYHIPAA
jgi:hypothetical protein